MADTAIKVTSSNPYNIYKNVYVNKENKINYTITHPDIKTNTTSTDAVVDSSGGVTLGSGKMFNLPIDKSRWDNITGLNVK